MKRQISAVVTSILSAVMLTGLLVAVQFNEAPSPTGPTVDAIQNTACGIPRRPDGGWPEPPPDPEEPEGPESVVQVELRCGNSRIGFGGMVMGGGVVVASKGSWTPKYGNPNPELTRKMATQSIDEIAAAIKELGGVPWPSPTATRAKDMDEYKVYSIMAFSEADNMQYQFKFGITKVGESRPKSQLAACQNRFGPWPMVKCRHFWLYQGVEGWLRARHLEALHAARYRDWAKDCPPGMPRCL